MKRIPLLAVAAIAMVGCGGDGSAASNPGSPSGGVGVATEAPVEAVAQAVSSSGGVIAIHDASSPMNGFEFSVPEGALPSGATIRVGFAKVTSLENAPGFQAASPLISIRSTVERPESLVNVTIPVSVPAGAFAVGFAYDSATGKYEGLPLVGADERSITVATSALGGSSASGAAGRSLGDPQAVLRIIALSIDAKALADKAVVNTGFKPGTDDWEFTNYGSYLAPGGNCAGQSITAMWYYTEKALKGAPHLHHLFDRVDKDSATLWQDNPLGYKFASVVQADLDWSGWMRKAFVYARDNPALHQLSWKAFAATMLLTGEPQYVGLKSDSGGHAIIAHRMSLRDSILYVSDPNFPGKEREIRFSGGRFQPYGTMQNAGQAEVAPYRGVAFFAKTAMIDWKAVGDRYAQLEDKTIGTIAPNAFPAYTIETLDKPDPIGDTIQVRSDTLALEVLCPTCATSYANSGRQFFQVFDASGQKVSDALAGEANQGLLRGQTALVLKPGRQTLGFAISGLIPVAGQPGKATRNWLDFRWVTIDRCRMAVTPATSSGETGVAYTFSAAVGCPASDPLYEWVVTDGKDSVVHSSTGKGATSTQVAFSASGSYQVKVRLYDGDVSRLVDSATAAMDIQTKGAKSFSFSWQGKLVYDFGLPYSFTLSGTVTGLDGNTIDSIFMNDYNPGTVHVYMPMFGNKKFRVQASISATLSKTVLDSTPPDAPRWRFSITGSARNRITTSRLDPYFYAQSSTVDLERTGDGDVIFEPYWSYKMETFDTAGVVVKTDTGTTSPTASAVIQFEGN